jgi:hypothetical protein
MAPGKAYFEGGASRPWAEFLAGIQKEKKHPAFALQRNAGVQAKSRSPQVARAFEAVIELLNKLLTTETQRTGKKGLLLCASVSLWLMQSSFSRLLPPLIVQEQEASTRAGRGQGKAGSAPPGMFPPVRERILASAIFRLTGNWKYDRLL